MNNSNTPALGAATATQSPNLFQTSADKMLQSISDLVADWSEENSTRAQAHIGYIETVKKEAEEAAQAAVNIRADVQKMEERYQTIASTCSKMIEAVTRHSDGLDLAQEQMRQAAAGQNENIEQLHEAENAA